MSCYNNCYLPRPPREWSRVQNSCSLIIDSSFNNNTLVQVPYTGKIVPLSQLAFQLELINKGNILQYKKNSSNLTKNQYYSKLAKGQWTNRNTTWATQSTRGYTNPNTQSLKRVGAINITLDTTPTNLPVSCAPPIDVIQDFGVLLCNVQENICTGQVINKQRTDNCNLTSDSDVPGSIIELCWNDGIQTWYPKSRYVMTNSGNKWPVNAPLFSAIIITPPTITSVNNFQNTDIIIQWTQDYSCLPITSYTIYQNGTAIDTLEATIFTYTISNVECGTYNFYITSNSQRNSSQPSNTISINIPCIPFITITATTPSHVPIQKTSSNGLFYYYEFVSNDTYTITINKPINKFEYLIVAKGGNGGTGFSSASLNGRSGGGGGSGGSINGYFSAGFNNTYTLTQSSNVTLSDLSQIAQAIQGNNGTNGNASAAGTGGNGGSATLSKYNGTTTNGSNGSDGIFSNNTSITPAIGGNGANIINSTLNIGNTIIDYGNGGNGGNNTNLNGFIGVKGGGGGGGAANNFINGIGANGGSSYSVIYFSI